MSYITSAGDIGLKKWISTVILKAIEKREKTEWEISYVTFIKPRITNKNFTESDKSKTPGGVSN